MIVRNEENYLAECLSQIAGAVAEIVIVDTGSTDKTIAIAEQFTPNVFTIEWANDFSQARNFALSKCSSPWILSLDADELLDKPHLLSELATSDNDAFLLPIKSYNGPNPEDYSITCVLRLFRNNPSYRFSGCIHEQLAGIPYDKVGTSDQPVIIHRCLGTKLRNGKRHRNINLLRRQISLANDNYLYQYYLGCEWLAFHNYRQAYKCFQMVYAQLPDNCVMVKSGTVKRLIACQRALGNIKEALCLCLQAALIYPDYTDIFFDGGIILEQFGEYEAALQWFTIARSLQQPPLTYWHLNGSGSFLACYHLGYCHQQLHRSAEAISWYEQALAGYPAFVYPLAGLFTLLSLQKPPHDVYKYFLDQGLTTTSDQQLLLAELFFAAGTPEYSLQLLQTTSPDSCSEQLIRYLIYNDNPQQALNVIGDGPLDCSSSPLAVYRVLAAIMLKRYDLAKQTCLTIWPNSDLRHISQALLLFINQFNNRHCILPANFNCTRLLPIWRQILADCQRCSNKSSATILAIITACHLLLCGSPDGATAFVDYCHKEIAAIEHLLDINYAEVRGLYACGTVQ